MGIFVSVFVVAACVEINNKTCRTHTKQLAFIGKKKMQRHSDVCDVQTAAPWIENNSRRNALSAPTNKRTERNG